MKSLQLSILLLLMVGCGGPTKRCLVSPLSGTIVTNGVPVADVKVTLEYHSHWYEERIQKVTHTDAKGYFEFAGVWKKALVDVLHQPVIEQAVIVECNSTNYIVYDVTKMEYTAFAELFAVQNRDPDRKDRLSKQNGKLYFKFDLESDKIPIGRHK